MMNCQHCREVLAESSGGPRGPASGDELADHLQTCQACGRYARELEHTFRLLGQQSVPEMPDVFWSSMEHAIMAKIASVETPRRRWYDIRAFREFATVFNRPFSWQPLHGLAMIVLLVFIFGGLYFFREPTVTPELTLASAAALCDDPEIWASLPWIDIQETDEVTASDVTVVDTTGDDELDDTLLLFDDITSAREITLTADNDDSVWSLIDDLDDQERQLLIAEFALQENV